MKNRYVSINRDDSVRLCIVEKIHGQNISIRFNSNEFEIRTRNEVVNNDFLKDRNLENEYLPLVEFLKNKYPSCEIIIYGELFGGIYDNNRNDKFKCIQEGISYSIDLHYLIFDISINGAYLPISVTFKYLSECGLKIIPYSVIKGDIVEIISMIKSELHNKESKVYKLYNHERLNNNIVEGVVIRFFEDTPDFRLKILQNNYLDKARKSSKSNLDNKKIEVDYDISLKLEKEFGKYNIDYNNSKTIPFKEIIESLLNELIEENIELSNSEIVSLVKRKISEFLKSKMIKF